MREGENYQYYEDVNLGLLRLWGKRTGLRVLDAGCGYATTSERIQKLGNHVTGIESSPAAVARASQRLERVVQADLLDHDAIRRELGDAKFDVIVFADVLEHLAWPLGTLRSYLQYLAAGGSVIISLPNVGLWSARFAHLFGSWEYEATGVLDFTHLRFFTRKSARRMIADAGLTPVRTVYNPGLIRPLAPLMRRVLGGKGPADPTALLNFAPYRLYLKTVFPFERAVASLWPGLLAFQLIYEAKRTA